MLGFSAPDVPEIDARKVNDAINSGKNVIILDVRTPQELARGYIKGSINIPLQDLSAEIENKLPDKDKIVYVYCLSGSRSAQAVDLMQKAGYKNSYSMTSGLLSWRANQFPLEVAK